MTGFFEDQTRIAVQYLQCLAYLKIDGIVGTLRSCTFLNSPPSNEFGANRQNPLKWVESLSAKFLSPF
jgi:hypothetical protein